MVNRKFAGAITSYVLGREDEGVRDQLMTLDMEKVVICLCPSLNMRYGPSVGPALFVSLVSMVTKVSCHPRVAMTGEVGLW